jgi:hypothetical protein
MIILMDPAISSLNAPNWQYVASEGVQEEEPRGLFDDSHGARVPRDADDARIMSILGQGY